MRPDRSLFPGDDGFRFNHVLIRDVAYGSMPKELRSRAARAPGRLARGAERPPRRSRRDRRLPPRAGVPARCGARTPRRRAGPPRGRAAPSRRRGRARTPRGVGGNRRCSSGPPSCSPPAPRSARRAAHRTSEQRSATWARWSRPSALSTRRSTRRGAPATSSPSCARWSSAATSCSCAGPVTRMTFGGSPSARSTSSRRTPTSRTPGS